MCFTPTAKHSLKTVFAFSDLLQETGTIFERHMFPRRLYQTVIHPVCFLILPFSPPLISSLFYLQMQIYLYNPDDFDSLSAAIQEKRIIAAMSVFLQVGAAVQLCAYFDTEM